MRIKSSFWKKEKKQAIGRSIKIRFFLQFLLEPMNSEKLIRSKIKIFFFLIRTRWTRKKYFDGIFCLFCGGAESWVEVIPAPADRVTPLPFGSGGEEYLRLLREAQRDSTHSSARHSLASSRRDTPKGRWAFFFLRFFVFVFLQNIIKFSKIWRIGWRHDFFLFCLLTLERNYDAGPSSSLTC